jgi:molybdenum cofactor cytidylyltransferase
MSRAAVGAVILAAGAGRRMGHAAKALLALGPGDTFLSVLASTLRRGGVAGPVLVVTGAHRAAVTRAALELGLRPVHNPQHARGQLGSARRGLSAALRLGLPGVLLLPCDLPELSSATVRRLLAARSPAVPVHRGRPGHPVALDHESIRRLLAVRGAENLREAMRTSGVRPGRVPVSDPAIHQNLNTVLAYRRALSRRAVQAKSLSRRPAASS